MDKSTKNTEFEKSLKSLPVGSLKRLKRQAIDVYNEAEKVILAVNRELDRRGA